MKLIHVLFLTVFVFPAFSQPSINWTKSYGSQLDEQLGTMIESYDGNILAAGVREHTGGNAEVLIYKINPDGDILSENNIVYGNASIVLYSMIYTNDNSGYIIIGQYRSNLDDNDFLTIKMDESGNFVWSETYGGSEHDLLYEIVPNGNGYILAGTSNSTNGDVNDHIGHHDYWLVWIDENGSVTGSKSYGGAQGEQLTSMIKTTDNNLILSGHSHTFINEGSQADFWIVKTDINGAILWSKSYGGTEAEFLPYVIEVDNDDFIIAGQSASNDFDIPMDNHGDHDFFACRIDQNGEILWSKSYGGSDWDYLYTLENGYGNSAYLGGFTRSDDGDITNGHYGGANDYWMVKIDKSNGDLLWQNNFGGSEGDILNDFLLIENNVYVGGSSYSDDFDIDADNHGGSDYWIVKLEEMLSDVSDVYSEQLNILPNPANDYLNIVDNLTIQSFRIFNLSGSKILEGKPENGIINIKDLHTGIYFLEVYDDSLKSFYTTKFVKM